MDYKQLNLFTDTEMKDMKLPQITEWDMFVSGTRAATFTLKVQAGKTDTKKQKRRKTNHNDR